MRGGGRLLLCAAFVLAAALSTGCRVERPERLSPSVAARVNSLPPARLRHSERPPEPPVDHSEAWLIDQQCGECHSIERVAKARLDWTGWRGQVGHMVQHGARLTVAEQQAIVDYLAWRW